MRLFPPEVHQFRSNAERKIFDLLRQTDLGPDAFAVHSLNLSQHDYKRWAEIDFVVVWEEGVYALEIKGGRVSCTDGIWVFTNRFDETHRKSEGPFEQVKTGHDALRTALNSQPGDLDLSGFCWGWGVMFPDIDFDISSVSWAPELVADHNEIYAHKDLGHFLRRLAKWWRGQGRGHRKFAAPPDITALRQAMRPDFEKVPSIGVSIDQAVDTIVRLTNEQIDVLDAVEENNRLICTGGAGTGKTFLAIEAARREAAAGRQVILVCRSPIFAAFLRSRIRPTGVTVTDFHSIASIIQRKTIFDVLIIDEAQDLLTDPHISRLEQLVRGGMEHGRWRMFLDLNNQSGLHEPPDQAVVARLQGIAARHRLKRNCRNTKQIVRQTQLMTGADIGVAIIEGEGPPISIVDINGERETADALERRMEEWLDDGVRPGHISILSPVPMGESAVRYLSPWFKKQLVQVDARIASSWPPDILTYSTIRDFKGLENRCIAVVDLQKFSASTSDVAELYVAMTRAHAGLWIAVPKQQRSLLNNLISEHASRLLNLGAPT